MRHFALVMAALQLLALSDALAPGAMRAAGTPAQRMGAVRTRGPRLCDVEEQAETAAANKGEAEARAAEKEAEAKAEAQAQATEVPAAETGGGPLPCLDDEPETCAALGRARCGEPLYGKDCRKTCGFCQPAAAAAPAPAPAGDARAASRGRDTLEGWRRRRLTQSHSTTRPFSSAER